MIYLELFLSFFKVGALSFGGGYGMISFIRETVLEKAWLTEAELLNFIAIAESTPGPIAVNIATFIGSSQGGFTGALVATLGVVLPSFIIILIIAAFVSNLLKYSGIKAFLSGMRPSIVGLIFATAVTLSLSSIMSFKSVGDAFLFDAKGLIILSTLLVSHFVIKKLFKKQPSPIIMIIFSAALGIVFYGFLNIS